MSKLTQARLKELLNYDEKTGDFTWKENRGGTAKTDKIAGHKKANGYIYISIDCKTYSGHRLVWLYVHGYIPELEIDHTNRIKSDNRILNLREVSHSCNMQNYGVRSNNITGIRGISFHKKSKKFRAEITINKKTIYLGIFASKFTAAKARAAAEVKYKWDICNTFKSSAYKYIQEHQ